MGRGGSPSLTSETGFVPPLPPAAPWEREVRPAAGDALLFPAVFWEQAGSFPAGRAGGCLTLLSPAVPPAAEPAGHQERVHPGLLVRRLHLDREEVAAAGAGGSAEAEPGAVRHAAPAQARHGHQEPGGHRVPGRAAPRVQTPRQRCWVGGARTPSVGVLGAREGAVAQGALPSSPI